MGPVNGSHACMGLDGLAMGIFFFFFIKQRVLIFDSGGIQNSCTGPTMLAADGQDREGQASHGPEVVVLDAPC